jgi:predicted thioesterase
MKPLSPGTEETFGYRVEARHLASSLDGSDGLFPAVYSTAFLVGLMEGACARLLARSLDADELSVGAGLERVTHVAPTPEGVQVHAVARFVALEGRFFHFEVQAFDDRGLIGEASHRRAVVKAEAFYARAAKR